jgi:hypothetical protein
MARWSSKLNLLLTAQDALSRPVRGASASISGLGRATDRSSQSLRRFGLQAGRIVADMQGFTRALDITSAGSLFLATRLDRMTTMLSAQTGGTRQEIDALQDTMLSLATTSGASIDTVSELTTALAGTGQAVTEQSTGLVRLIDTWGLSAQSAVELKKTTEALGGSLDTLLDTAAGYQKQFNLPVILAQMPAIMGFAVKSLTQFSKAVVHDEKSVIDSTIKTGAIFSRTFGKPFSEGVQMAEANFNQFSAALENTRNVFLGIDQEFGPMQQALFETGMGVDQVQALLTQGQKSAVDATATILKRYEMLQELKGPMMAERFLVNMKKTAPEMVRLYLSNSEAFEEAQEQQAQTLDFTGGSWEKMTKSMRGNAGTALATFDNLLGTIKEIIGSGLQGVIRKIFGKESDEAALQGVNQTFKDLGLTIIKFKDTVLNSAIWQKGLEPILVGMGKLAVYFTAASGAIAPLTGLTARFASAIKFVLSPLHALTGAADFGIGVVGSLAGTLGNASLAVAGFALAIPGLNFLLTPLFGLLGVGLKTASLGFSGLGAVGTKNLALIGAGLNQVGAIIRGKTTVDLNKLANDVPAKFEKVGDALDSVLGGMPTKILNYFMPPKEGEAAKTLAVRMRSLGVKVSNLLRAWNTDFVGATRDLFGSVAEGINQALGGAPDVLIKALFDDPKATFAAKATEVGQWIGDHLKFWTNKDKMSEWWSTQLTLFNTWIKDREKDGTFAEWGTNIAAAIGKGISLLKGILGMSDDTSFMAQANASFFDIGMSIGNGLLAGVGTAIERASPALVNFLGLGKSNLKASAAAEASTAAQINRATSLTPLLATERVGGKDQQTHDLARFENLKTSIGGQLSSLTSGNYSIDANKTRSIASKYTDAAESYAGSGRGNVAANFAQHGSNALNRIASIRSHSYFNEDLFKPIQALYQAKSDAMSQELSILGAHAVIAQKMASDGNPQTAALGHSFQDQIGKRQNALVNAIGLIREMTGGEYNSKVWEDPLKLEDALADVYGGYGGREAKSAVSALDAYAGAKPSVSSPAPAPQPGAAAPAAPSTVQMPMGMMPGGMRQPVLVNVKVTPNGLAGEWLDVEATNEASSQGVR